MSDELLIRHCAPTLAGLKTANMFNCTYGSKEEMRKDIRALNSWLSKKGVIAIPLRFSGNTALIYIVRVKSLKEDLLDKQTLEILREQGYSDLRPARLISRLAKRLSGCDFPHEIGLFLGYPPEDVVGFIEKRECKFTGYWKVYSDVNFAKNMFDKYSKCFRIYMTRVEAGFSAEKLTVA